MDYKYLKDFENNVINPLIIRLIKSGYDNQYKLRYMLRLSLNNIQLDYHVIKDIIDIILFEGNLTLIEFISEIERSLHCNIDKNKKSLINFIKNSGLTYYILLDPINALINTFYTKRDVYFYVLLKGKIKKYFNLNQLINKHLNYYEP